MDVDVSVRKAALRSEMRAALRAMTSSQRREQSEAIVARVRSLPWYAEARTVMLFAPLDDEPDVRSLTTGAGVDGTGAGDGSNPKRFALPRVDWASGSLQVVQFADWSRDLVLARLNLREPREDLRVLSPRELDLALVPGLAFSRSGQRLGRGKGFYDRFIHSLGPVRPKLVGVAFAPSVVGGGSSSQRGASDAESFPADRGDADVDAVVSPTEFIVAR